jgi:hypothetical protein
MIGHQRRHDVSSKTISDRASETNLLPAMREVAVTASQERTGAGVATGCHGTEDPCLPLPDNGTKATTRGAGQWLLSQAGHSAMHYRARQNMPNPSLQQSLPRGCRTTTVGDGVGIACMLDRTTLSQPATPFTMHTMLEALSYPMCLESAVPTPTNYPDRASLPVGPTHPVHDNCHTSHQLDGTAHHGSGRSLGPGRRGMAAARPAS